MFWNVQFSLAPPVQVQPPISRKNACIKARNPLDRAQNMPRTKRSHSAHSVPLTTNPPLAPVKRAKGVRGHGIPAIEGRREKVERRKAQSITLLTSPHSAFPFAASRLRVSRTACQGGLNTKNAPPKKRPHLVLVLSETVLVLVLVLENRVTGRCPSRFPFAASRLRVRPNRLQSSRMVMKSARSKHGGSPHRSSPALTPSHPRTPVRGSPTQARARARKTEHRTPNTEHSTPTHPVSARPPQFLPSATRRSCRTLQS